VIFDNIIKFVRFQLSTNIGAILTVLAATLTGCPPFTAIQLLWINIIMDAASDDARRRTAARRIMNAPPRPQDAHILTPARLGRLSLYGATMMVGTLWLFHSTLQEHGQEHGQEHALTMAFTTFVLFQFFNLFNARSEYGSAFNPLFLRNVRLWLALGGVLALQVVVVHWPPAQEIFTTTHLGAIDWATCALVASSVLFLDEARKLLVRIRARFA